MTSTSAKPTANGQRIAIVAGGTGLVGRELVHLLVHEPAYRRVVVLTRRELGEGDPVTFLEGAALAIVDFERLDETFPADVDGADLFCCLGTTRKKAGSAEAFRRVDYDFVLDFAKAGQVRGAARFFLVSSTGANARSALLYSRTKGEAEADVAALGFEAVHIFRPSMLNGEREESRPAERIGLSVMKATDLLFRGPLRRYAAIHVKDVARSMLEAAKDAQPGVVIHESETLHERS